ncbi:MAG: ABC transporter permease, partial [Bdellovibrionaceae bacterium]|nr:ABC transporter permease [Pseudobdellovibrionaceae bacterium]
GTGFNLLAAGLIPLATKALFGYTGSTPQLPIELRFTHPWGFVAVAAACVIGYVYLFRYTRHGLRILAAGENPQALITQGVSARLLRVRAVVEGSLVAGIGGVYLSLCQGSGYIRDMSAGRGFIALAALIFGAWRPVPTLLACVFFALTDAIQIQLQGKVWAGITVPNQFVQIIPYVATLLVLVVMARRISAPQAINRN